MRVSSSTRSTRAAALFVAIGVTAACSSHVGGQAVSPTEVPPPTTVAGTSLPPAPQPTAGFGASFDELAKTLPAGEVGVTVTDGHQVLSFGTWTAGAAWSTIKVPLSIAAMRQDSAQARPAMVQAITQSDNAAADELWAMLGTPPLAANSVQQVLADGGDTSVVVESRQVRPPYSAYGQTTWSLPEAARFAFALPCVAAAGEVLDEMHHISQGWGLAAVDGAAVKGGWGPEADGGYLVRQIALIDNDTGAFGVSVAAKPTNGSFDTGTAMLDGLAGWVEENRQQFPAGSC